LRSYAFASVLLAVCCVSAVASAGEVPTYKAPPLAATAPVGMPGNFYAGLSVGGRWSDTDWTTTETALAALPLPASASFDSSTARIGGYAGYMLRFAPTWAIGIEGDIAWGDSRKSILGIPGACCDSIASVKEGWDGSIRGRLGFLLAPAWLLYATGGIAWQSIDIDTTCGNADVLCTTRHSESLSKTKTGWTIGGGLEVMLRHNWLLRLEYRYADYGDVHHTFFTFPPVDHLTMNEFWRTQTLLAGFAYKLNGHSQ
jgi:outer membrane immunogenic protein